MSEPVHVDANLHADATMRDVLASTFGLVGNLPSHATTGCGLQVPYAMASSRQESVTCLACREFAHRRYLQLAGEVERMGRMPGVALDLRERAVGAAKRYRELAQEYAD